MKDTKLYCEGTEKSEPGTPQTPREAPTPLHSVGLEPPNLQRQLEILKVMYSKGRGDLPLPTKKKKRSLFFSYLKTIKVLGFTKICSISSDI